MKKTLSWFLYAFIFFLGVLLTVEVGLRLNLKYLKNDLKSRAMAEHVQKRIDRIWKTDRESRKIFWGPPYRIYWNDGLSDPERVKLIEKDSKLPEAGSWTSPNFLRASSESADHQFLVQTNSLGFRDRERQIKKDRSTFRIIVLGSYPAFGHGVDNEHTYSSRLEKILAINNPDKKIEIWNGGQQGSTAIMGYVRFKNELTRYKPDLVIFDYGWVDFFMRKDQTKEASPGDLWKIPNWSFMQKLGAKIRFTWFPRLLISKVVDNYTKKSFWNLNILQWQNIMSKINEYGIMNKIPILYLRHFEETVWPELYAPFVNKSNKIYFLDTTPSFKDKAVTQSIIKDFWSKTNWLTEMGLKEKDVKRQAKLYFRVDALQFNKHGHYEIAKYLAPFIQEKYIESN
jgi:hypothetical protein